MADLSTSWADSVGQQVNAAYLNDLDGRVNTRSAFGTFASRPAAGKVGALYFAQDNDTLYRDNGTTWDRVRIGSDSCDAMGDVPSTGWTAVNMQTGASWAQDKDAMLFTVPTIGSAHNFQYQYRAYPTPPFTLTAYIDVVFSTSALGSGGAFFGIGISDGTKLIVGGPAWFGTTGTPFSAAGFSIGGSKWSNATTFSAAYNTNLTPISYIGQLPKWYRFVDDNTNIKWQYSLNGIDWNTIGSEARTTFLTPTRIGAFADNYAGSGALMRVRSWNGVS